LDDILRSGFPPAQLAILFRFVFVAAAAFIAISLLAITAIEERPLGGARPDPPIRS
jgi:hypothetical protein